MAQEIADSTLLDTWSSGGNIVEPDISKIIEGWQLGEQPPHEYMNWLQNTFGSKLNHILKNGVASWNNETPYLAGSSVQHNGNVWLCKTTNTNSEPTDENANWKRIITVESLTDLSDYYVALTGDQTIAGVKTFSSSPIVPTPTTGTQAANKDYADSKQANLGFTPVQQGTGIGQFSNAVKIGWSGTRTKITIDATDMGNIVMDNDIGVANSSLVKTALNASGNAPIYACRAWVNFNGTGTIAIRASENVSSIADNGTGDYTVNFATAMTDKFFSTSLSCAEDYTNNTTGYTTGDRARFDVTTSSVRVWSYTPSSGARIDVIEYSVQIHR